MSHLKITYNLFEGETGWTPESEDKSIRSKQSLRRQGKVLFKKRKVRSSQKSRYWPRRVLGRSNHRENNEKTENFIKRGTRLFPQRIEEKGKDLEKKSIC